MVINSKTHKRCVNIVSDPEYKVQTGFLYCDMHVEKCGRMYQKYSLACSRVWNLNRPNALNALTDDQITKALEDAEMCASTRIEYTQECIQLNEQDPGHEMAIEKVRKIQKKLEKEVVLRARKTITGTRRRRRGKKTSPKNFEPTV